MASYANIENAYKFPEFFDGTTSLAAQEKVDGSSAYIRIRSQTEKEPELIHFYGGSAKAEAFEDACGISRDDLRNKFVQLCADVPGLEELTIYGEAYGGKIQKRSDVYGVDLRFVAFDVKQRILGTEHWLDVLAAEQLASDFGLRFVAYRVIKATKAEADAERDRESTEAIRNGMGPGRWSEGVVLKPMKMRYGRFGERLICKHKRPDARETKSVREISPEKIQALADARKIADEFVVPERVGHVASKILAERRNAAGASGDERLGMSDTPDMLRAVLADVRREAGDEVVWVDGADRAVCTRASELFRGWLEKQLTEEAK